MVGFGDIGGIGHQRVDILLHLHHPVVGKEDELAGSQGVDVPGVGQLGGHVHRVGIGGVGQGLVILGPSQGPARPPGHLLGGEGGAVAEHNAAHDVDHKAVVRVGEPRGHQLGISPLLRRQALHKGHHRVLHGGVGAVVNEYVEFVGFDGCQEVGVIGGCGRTIGAAGERLSHRGGQGSGTTPGHPVVGG